jgi:hypothetical protein
VAQLLLLRHLAFSQFGQDSEVRGTFVGKYCENDESTAIGDHVFEENRTGHVKECQEKGILFCSYRNTARSRELHMKVIVHHTVEPKLLLHSSKSKTTKDNTS